MSKQERRASKEHYDAAFLPGGNWEGNGGPEQTRVYADAFCKHTQIQLEGGASLLDSSCALGQAFPLLAKRFPGARLFGSDISTVAVQRATECYGNLGSFSAASFEEIQGTYDAILTSHTLEHFTDYKEKARTLLRHCKCLCILVPYNEKRAGKDLEYSPRHDHVVTFREHSFDFLIEEGLADRVRCEVFALPGDRSWALKEWIRRLKNIARFFLGRPIVARSRQILFEVYRRG